MIMSASLCDCSALARALSLAFRTKTDYSVFDGALLSSHTDHSCHRSTGFPKVVVIIVTTGIASVVQDIVSPNQTLLLFPVCTAGVWFPVIVENHVLFVSSAGTVT